MLTNVSRTVIIVVRNVVTQGIASFPNYSFISPNYSSLVNYIDTVIGLTCIPDTSVERESYVVCVCVCVFAFCLVHLNFSPSHKLS